MDVLLTERKVKRARAMRIPTLLEFERSGYSRMMPGPMPMLSREELLDIESPLLAPRNRHISRREAGREQAPMGQGGVDPALLSLLERTTFGFSQSAYDDAAAMGYEAYLESQLDPASIDDSEIDAMLAPFDTLPMTGQEIYDTYPNMLGVPAVQLIDATILRGILSKRQLLERMVQFWTDHFNINMLDGLVPYFKNTDDREVIRQNALTTFPQLLNASAKSAAMLYYLDNYANIVGHAQENYARELMELHTMGVNGGYTQTDVEEVARCFTGWTIYFSPQLGEFVFYEPYHDFEAKTVLGQFIPAGGGESDAQTVLDILAHHPSTAGFIARKLCTRFVGYDPPEDIVQSVKATYLATGGDIKAMLRVILQRNVITYLTTPKFKRPFHLVASMLRATNADILSIGLARNNLVVMGHAPFLWGTPDGYPDTLEAWGSALLLRWGFASALFDGTLAGITVDAPGLLAAAGGNDPASGTQGTDIDMILTGGRLNPAEVSALQQYYNDVAAQGPPAVNDTFGLAASVPGFQWY